MTPGEPASIGEICIACALELGRRVRFALAVAIAGVAWVGALAWFLL